MDKKKIIILSLLLSIITSIKAQQIEYYPVSIYTPTEMGTQMLDKLVNFKWEGETPRSSDKIYLSSINYVNTYIQIDVYMSGDNRYELINDPQSLLGIIEYKGLLIRISDEFAGIDRLFTRTMNYRFCPYNPDDLIVPQKSTYILLFIEESGIYNYLGCEQEQGIIDKEISDFMEKMQKR